MSRRPPSRWLLLWFFLFVMVGALIQAPIRLRGHLEGLPLYMVGAAAGFVILILVTFGLAVRRRRLWIEDRRARGLRTYEQPRDAISDNPIIRRILFLPPRNSN
jgi:hypothetical protein